MWSPVVGALSCLNAAALGHFPMRLRCLVESAGTKIVTKLRGIYSARHIALEMGVQPGPIIAEPLCCQGDDDALTDS